MMSSNLIIFDFDGVINNSIKISLDIFRELVEKYNIPIKPTRENYIKVSSSNWRQLKRDFEVSLFKTLRVFLHLKRTLRRREKEFHAFFEMKKVLEKLAINNTLALITIYRGDIKKVLERMGIINNFDLVFKASSREKKSEKMKKCLNKLNFTKEKSILISDDVKDILEAKEVGVKSVAVTWGMQTEEELMQVKPDFIIHKPEEISELM